MFPAQFISEAVDQTRGWFYLPSSDAPPCFFNKAPYENVVVMGLVLDENGQKMSKSKGNAVDPFEALATHGADAIHWFFYTCSAPWLPKRYQDKAVTEGQRKFMGSCGTPTHSGYCMPILTSLMQPNTAWSMTSCPLWTAGSYPR